MVLLRVSTMSFWWIKIECTVSHSTHLSNPVTMKKKRPLWIIIRTAQPFSNNILYQDSLFLEFLSITCLYCIPTLQQGMKPVCENVLYLASCSHMSSGWHILSCVLDVSFISDRKCSHMGKLAPVRKTFSYMWNIQSSTPYYWYMYWGYRLGCILKNKMKPWNVYRNTTFLLSFFQRYS